MEQEYRFLKRTCPDCGTNLNAHRSAVVTYSNSQPMGPCPTCGKANPLNAPKKKRDKMPSGEVPAIKIKSEMAEKEIFKGENEDKQ